MRSLSPPIIALSAVAATLLCAPAAHAQQTVSFTATIPNTEVDFDFDFQLRQFDASLGQLTRIDFTLLTTQNATVDVFNPTADVRQIDSLSGSLPIAITGPSGLSIVGASTSTQTFQTPRTINPNEALEFTGFSSSATRPASLFSGFAPFVGSGTSTATLRATSLAATASGTGSALLQYGAFGNVGGQFTVTYTYTAATTAAAPEPAAAALLTAGLAPLGVVALRRRRRA